MRIDLAASARRIRDRALTEGVDGRAVEDLDRLRRRVTRSRILRWSLTGIGPPGGDAYNRLISLLEASGRDDILRPAELNDALNTLAAALPDQLDRVDLSAARLITAGLTGSGV